MKFVGDVKFVCIEEEDDSVDSFGEPCENLISVRKGKEFVKNLPLKSHIHG